MTIIGSIALPGGAGRLSTADWAFQELWSRIVTGRLAAGERVTEDSLAELLNVSRTPLREALPRLEEIGLLLRQRNRTLLVAPMSAEDAEELTLIREQLEVLAARLAARNSADNADAVRQMWHDLERMKALQGFAAGPTPVLRLGEEFHISLLQLSGSQRLGTMLSHVYLAIERYRYLLNENQDRAAEIAQEHEEVLAAVADGDETAAEAAMRRHVSHSRALYLDELRKILPKTRPM